MTTDDVLAWMASQPKKNRPPALRSDTKMLAAWLRLRVDDAFRDDMLSRHGLADVTCIDLERELHTHAIANAWADALFAATKK